MTPPATISPPRPSITDATAAAIARTDAVLFKPLLRQKWLILGVASWLANINEWRGLGGLFELIPHGILYAIYNPDGFAATLQHRRVALISAMLGISVVLFAAYLLFRWLNCRGQFMLLAAAVEGNLAIKESWRRYKTLGNSLLKFRIGWDLIIFNIFLLIMVVAAVLLWPDFRPMFSGADYRFSGWTWSAIIVGATGTGAALIFILLGTLFIDNVMVPVMFVLNLPAKQALRHAWRNIFRPQRGPCIRFLLTMMLIEMLHGMAMSAAMLVVILGTLGIGLLLLLIPLISLLPLYPMATMALAIDIFSRSTCLYYLEQFGPEYRVNWQGRGLANGGESE